MEHSLSAMGAFLFLAFDGAGVVARARVDISSRGVPWSCIVPGRIADDDAILFFRYHGH